MQEPTEASVHEQPIEEQAIDEAVLESPVIDAPIIEMPAMQAQQLQKIIESALMAYSQPLTIEKLQTLFTGDHLLESGVESVVPEKSEVLAALAAISESCHDRGFELKKVSSGWRFQVRTEMAPWINKLWEEKPQRYSRALLETLSIIAYRQPITRGDIEEIRGVAVSSHIIKTLSEREWIKVIGHRDVPGRPALFATTKQFLDYFNLENLEDLPSLRELADIDSLTPELDLEPSESPVQDVEANNNDSDNLELDLELDGKVEVLEEENEKVEEENEKIEEENKHSDDENNLERSSADNSDDETISADENIDTLRS